MNRLNYHHLYLFWTLAKEGTFTKTAEKLSIAQSAVTSQIKQLEDLLGLQLIDRTNRRKPILTEEGQKTLDYAKSIFETGDELLKWSQRGKVSQLQTLKIGALSGLSRNLQYEFFAPIIKNSNVKIEVITGDQEKLVKLLKEHSLDLILSSHNVSAEGRSHLQSHVLTKSPLVFVVHGSDITSGKDLKYYLEKKPLYIPGSSFESRAELDAFLNKQKISLQIAGEIDDTALLRLFAVKTNAVVAIPELGVINEIQSRELRVVHRLSKIEQKYYAITRQKKFPNETIEYLIDCLQK